MAVFKHVDNMSWFSLGKGYRESVFFKIDNEVLGLEEERAEGCLKEEADEDKGQDSRDPVSETLSEDAVSYSELPGRKTSPTTKASYCREILHEIERLTHVIDDMDALENLAQELKSTLENLKPAAPQDFGLTVENKKEREKIEKRKIQSTKWKDLQKRKKLKLSGRVGISFENKKRAQQISIDIPQPKCIEQEVITMNDDDVSYDKPLYSSLITISDDEHDMSTEVVPSIETVDSSVATTKGKNEMNKESEFLNVETTIIERVRLNKKNPRTVILRNGSFTLSYIELLSLESNHPADQLAQIKSIEKEFRTGWLTDAVVDSFVLNILLDKPHLLSCGAVEAFSISRGYNFRLLWKGLNYLEKKAILIPFNLNGWHWTLIYMNLATREYTFLDPMSNTKHTNAMVKVIVDRIVAIKLNDKVEWKQTFIDHTTQNDCMSCGVYVCYFAEQLALGNYNLFLSFIIISKCQMFCGLSKIIKEKQLVFKFIYPLNINNSKRHCK